MIIVSQNKLKIINFNNVTMIRINAYVGKFCIICDFPNSLYEIVGTYETEERAKEVLKEIVDEYQGTEGFKVCIDMLKIETATEAMERSFKYEMPLE